MRRSLGYGQDSVTVKLSDMQDWAAPDIRFHLSIGYVSDLIVYKIDLVQDWVAHKIGLHTRWIRDWIYLYAIAKCEILPHVAIV